jgi:4-hydroxy-3-polyprenylbenzoate decarboxylase
MDANRIAGRRVRKELFMTEHGSRRVVVGVTGASGALYAKRVVELLADAGIEIHLAVTALGRRLLADELGMKRLDLDGLSNGRGERITLHNDNDLGAPIASGSFLHDGMVIVPASSNTLGAIAAGISENLVQRAAMVALKERRPLLIAHRESPLTLIDIDNMQRLAQAGAIIAPLNPGFYLLPQRVDDLVDFMAGKLLDLIHVPHDLNTRWDEHLARQKAQTSGSRPAKP